jgi:ferredoxin
MSGRLVVDWTRCDGHGLCAALAPDHVGLDEWGFPVIDPDLPEGEARRLAQACPVLALRVGPARSRTAPAR